MSNLVIPAERAARHGGPDFFKGGAKFAETFEIWGGLSSKDTVLDIGCGPGRMAIGIGERFNWENDLIGFDVIKIDADICRNVISSQHPNFKFVHVNAWNGHYNPAGTIQPYEVEFPALDNSIDFAFATSVFTHMYKREAGHYLKECYRVLKAGGRLFSTWFSITDATSQSKHARLNFSHALHDGSFTDFPDRPEEVIGFKYEEITDLFQSSGFKSVTFFQGDWSKTADRSTVRHGQDVFICTK